MGNHLAHPVDIDTADDAPERVQRRVHCTRIIEHVTKVAEIEASVRMTRWNTWHRIKRKLNILMDCVNYRVTWDDSASDSLFVSSLLCAKHSGWDSGVTMRRYTEGRPPRRSMCNSPRSWRFAIWKPIVPNEIPFSLNSSLSAPSQQHLLH